MAEPELIEGLRPGSAAFYRRRFESSVMGNHMMMPPAPVAGQMVHPEAPPTHPKGPNTNFGYPTPMPFRYTDDALPAHNARHTTTKEEHPIYTTTASEIGKLPIQYTDFPMRWYGLEGEFTKYCTSGGMALPKTKTASGLNTSMDHSKFHHEYDQGWRGNLGLTDFNVPNRECACPLRPVLPSCCRDPSIHPTVLTPLPLPATLRVRRLLSRGKADAQVAHWLRLALRSAVSRAISRVISRIISRASGHGGGGGSGGGDPRERLCSVGARGERGGWRRPFSEPKPRGVACGSDGSRCGRRHRG